LGPCIDPTHGNSNMEDTGSPLALYNLVFVYDAPTPSFFDPCATCGAVENDPMAAFQGYPCVPSVVGGANVCQTTEATPRQCFEASPCLACGGVGPGEPNPGFGFAISFCNALVEEARGAICTVNPTFGDCWQSAAPPSSICVPPTCFKTE